MKTGIFSKVFIGTIAATVASTPLTSCIKLELQLIKVTIDLDGGSLDGKTGTIYKEVVQNASYAQLGTPTKEGYSFLGWSIDGRMVDKDEKITSDVIVKATYECTQKYTVTIDLNGGTLGGETGTITKTVDKGTKYITLGEPLKQYYKFTNWSKDGQPVGQDETIETDVSIKAEYELEKWDIKINPNGGTIEGHNEEYTKSIDAGSTFAKLPKPTQCPEHNEFSHWSVNGVEKSETDIIEKDSVVKAEYKRFEYKVTVHLEQGESLGEETGPKDLEIWKNTGLTYRSLGSATKEHYSFEGWEDENGTKINLDSEIDNDIKIFPIFEQNEFCVSFEIGEGHIGDKTGTFQEWVEKGKLISDLTEPTPAEHYGFDYWKVDGEKATEGQTITKECTLTAVYNRTQYQLHIDLNGGHIGDQYEPFVIWVDANSTYGDLDTPEKQYFTFSNWTVNGQDVSDEDKITHDQDIVAKYTQNKRTVSIHLNGGTLDGKTGDVYDKEVNQGSTISELGTPTKEGTNFVTYYTGNLVLNGDYKIEDNIEIYATYIEDDENLCPVIIHLNGGQLNHETDDIIVKAFEKGNTYGQLGEPTKMGHYFKAWKKGEQEMPLTETINERTELNVVWEELNIQLVDPHFNLVDLSEGANYYDTGIGLNVFLMNDGDIPYVSIESYFAYAPPWSNPWAVTTKTETTIVVTNNNTQATCTFDFANQTIVFNDYDNFIDLNSDHNKNPLILGIDGENHKYETDSHYTSGNEYVIDLQKYNIPIYFKDSFGYMPYYFCKNIFNCDWTNGATFGSIFDISRFMFVSHKQTDGTIKANFYEIFDYGSTQISGYDFSAVFYFNYLAKTRMGIATAAPFFSRRYHEFQYNFFALTLDLRYGMTTRKSRANPNTTIEYFPNGALESLKIYHDSLVADENNYGVSNSAFIDIIRKNLCDDGGHTWYQGSDVSTYYPWLPNVENSGPEDILTSTVLSGLNTAREEAGHGLPEFPDPIDPENPQKWHSKIDIESSDGDEAKDIAWATFDEFKYVSGASYNYINENNYMEYGTYGMTMYLHKLVNTPDSKIKKIVIDLSCNGGGAVCTEHFLASYLCGRDNTLSEKKVGTNNGVTHTICNPETNAFSQYSFYADINGDGAINANDYLPEGVKLYCIVSDGSFSCGNMLPCHLADCAKCRFIGSNSGGGACYVDAGLHLGLGNIFQISSMFHSLRASSTVGNFITVDDGIAWDLYEIKCDADHYDDFFNRPTIISKLV